MKISSEPFPAHSWIDSSTPVCSVVYCTPLGMFPHYLMTYLHCSFESKYRPYSTGSWLGLHDSDDDGRVESATGNTPQYLGKTQIHLVISNTITIKENSELFSSYWRKTKVPHVLQYLLINSIYNKH